MAANILGLSLLAFTPVASSADANYPVTNLIDYRHPSRPWRSTAITQQAIVCDLGAPVAVSAVVFCFLANVLAVTIQGNSADSWGAPPFSQDVTITQDARLSRYKRYIALSGFTYRYLRVLIPAQTPVVAPLTAFSLGALALLFSPRTLSRAWDFGGAYEIVEPIREVGLADGGMEQSDLGSAHYKVEQQAKWSDQIALEADLLALQAIGKSQPFILYENNGDASHVYLVRRTSPTRITRSDKTRLAAAFAAEELI